MNKDFFKIQFDELPKPKGRLFLCRMAFELEGLTDKQRVFVLKHFICPEYSHEDLIKEFNADENFQKGISEAIQKLKEIYLEAEDYYGLNN